MNVKQGCFILRAIPDDFAVHKSGKIKKQSELAVTSGFKNQAYGF